MKKIMLVPLMIAVVIAMMLAAASAEAVDLESLSLDELRDLSQRTEALLRDAILQKTKDDMQAFTTENGLVLVDNGEEVMVRAYKGSETEVIIPAEYNGLPVTRIGERAFYHNDWITSVVLPDTVTIIGEDAFCGCGRLAGINLENVSEIHANAFSSAGLKGVLVLSAESVAVSSGAFSYTKLTGIRIYAKELKLKDTHNFANMDELEYIFFDRDCVITASDSFSHIGNRYHIGHNKKLEVVVLPGAVSFSSDEEFSSCTNLFCIYAPAGSEAANYARKHFLVGNTDEYERMYALFEQGE